MASLHQRPSGATYIKLKKPSGPIGVLSLGKVTRKQAAEILSYASTLESHGQSATTVPPHTAAWLGAEKGISTLK